MSEKPVPLDEEMESSLLKPFVPTTGNPEAHNYLDYYYQSHQDARLVPQQEAPE